jgi:putative tricarboxylic transport membrane protein
MDRPDDDRPVGQRGPELVVAAVLALLALLVIKDSLRVGIGWGDDGPRSGYFPFYIGSMLLGASAWILLRQLLTWASTTAVFAERSQIAGVVAVLWPMGVHVALIVPLGIYLASVLLIAWFMRRHGRFRAAPTAAVALGVPLLFFMVFERWFLVPLPKGPIERLLGF